MKQYSIEVWVPLDLAWKPIVSMEWMTRDEAERRLGFESQVGAVSRRCRLINNRGKVVMHAGRVQHG
jgi:hypothetical protein